MPNTLPNVARLTCEVALTAAPEDKSKPASFNVTPAYTGVPVKLAGWPLPLVIDLATLTQAKRITANLDHDRKQRVGHVTDVQNDGKSLAMAGLISGAGSAAREVAEASDNGYPWGGSIEVAFQRRNVAELESGKTAIVNGRKWEGPLLIGRKGTLFGVAMSDSPADDATDVSIAASSTKTITLGELRAAAR